MRSLLALGEILAVPPAASAHWTEVGSQQGDLVTDLLPADDLFAGRDLPRQ